MSGYGYYDEGEGEGLLTGAGARPKKRFVATRAVSARTGKLYPKRVGYTLEYASKILYNKELAKNNKWLQFANNDADVKAAREAMAKAMQNAAKKWQELMRQKLDRGEITANEYAKMKNRWDRAKKIKEEAGSIKAYREHIAQSRIDNFKRKFPSVEQGVAFLNNPINRKAAPIGRNAKIIFLRMVYKIPKDQAEKYFPKYMKVARPVKFSYPIEEAEMFNIPPYKKKEVEQPPPQPQPQPTTTPTGESIVLTPVQKKET
jgi:hypothetical protein